MDDRFWIWLAAGLVLGAAFIALARRLDERRVFAIGLVVAAAIYVGFALAGGAPWRWIGVEAIGVAVYGLLAWLGLRRARGWLALGWAAHVVWDVALHLTGAGRHFAPPWYATVCIGFDLLVAAWIAAGCWRRGLPGSPG